MTDIVDTITVLRTAYERGDWDTARALWHPDALLAGIASERLPLSRQDTILSVERAREAGVYSLIHGNVTLLDDSAVLAEGRCRYRHPRGGVADSPIFWVHTFVDGLLYRTGVFGSKEEAIGAYEAQGLTLGFTEPTALRDVSRTAASSLSAS